MSNEEQHMTDEPIDDLGDDGEAVVLLIRSAATIIFRTAERPEQAEKFLRGAIEAVLMDLRQQRPAAEHERRSVGQVGVERHRMTAPAGRRQPARMQAARGNR
jgi:hypothetical protein